MARLLILGLALCAYAASGAPNDSEPTEEAPDGTKFRPGYHFHPEANGWLKLHTFPAMWSDARLACHLEGATLASPLTEGLYSSMKDLLAKENKTAFTGISSMASVEDYFSIEGVHLSKMPIEWQEGEPNNMYNNERCLTLWQAGMADVRCEDVQHFLCYKEKVDGETFELNECGNYDKHYAKHPVTGSCYKFHDTAATWERAHTVCTAEGAHLAILNSEQEAEALTEMALKARAGKEPSFAVAVGFYYWPNSNGPVFPDKKPLIYSTLDGKDLEDSGYSRWAPADHEASPNTYTPTLYCGSFKVRKGELKGLASVDCHETYPFVCEVDAKKASA